MTIKVEQRSSKEEYSDFKKLEGKIMNLEIDSANVPSSQ